MGGNRLSLVQFKPIQTLGKNLSESGDIFRQTRLENDRDLLKLKIAGSEYTLVNWSRTGLAFLITGVSKSPFPIGLKLGPTEVWVGNILVYNGDILVKSAKKNSDSEIQVGAEFKSNLFMVEGIEAASTILNTIDVIGKISEQAETANAEVCKIILELASILRTVKAVCEDQERKLLDMTLDAKKEVLKIFEPSMAAELGSLLNEYSRRVESHIDVTKLPENSIYHRLFEEYIYPFFVTSDLARRAFEKPRGYAGDFEIMNQFYRNGFEGTDLFGRILHHYATSSDSAEPVKFRKPFFVSQIERLLDDPGEKKILSIACGPAVEVQEVVRRWTQSKLDRARFALLDLDRVALEHAQTKIYEACMEMGKNASVEFLCGSVKLILRSREILADQFDLIYSAGLFDYIDNLTAAALVRAFFKRVKKGGRLIVGNYTRNHSTKAFVHLITRWSLNHKTEEEIRGWAEGLEDCRASLEYDSKGVQAFLILEKA